MDAARIATLLHPFTDRTLPEVQLQQISMYIDLLLRWNARINLTAIRDPDEIVTRHFGESFFLARHLFPEPSVERTLLSASPKDTTHPTVSEAQPPRATFPEVGSRSQASSDTVSYEPAERSARPAVLDLGAGAGFPGIPMKLWCPDISLTLVESNHKKAAFLREVIRALTLTDVNVITARAETLPETTADIVTLRAVERFDAILPIAARLVHPSGRLALLIGSSQLPSLRTLAPNFQAIAPISVPNSQSRVLSILVRLAEVGS